MREQYEAMKDKYHAEHLKYQTAWDEKVKIEISWTEKYDRLKLEHDTDCIKLQLEIDNLKKSHVECEVLQRKITSLTVMYDEKITMMIRKHDDEELNAQRLLQLELTRLRELGF